MIDRHRNIPTEKLAEFCRRWRITEMSLFGSALRDDFGPESDIDILVTFAPDAHPTLFTLQDVQTELEALFGRRVDIMTRRAVELSRNPWRRRAILESSRVLYAA